MQASLLNFKTIVVTYYRKKIRKEKKNNNKKGVPQTPPISKIEFDGEHIFLGYSSWGALLYSSYLLYIT